MVLLPHSKRYMSADDGTYISAATQDFDSVVVLMDQIDTDMRTQFKNIQFYPSPLTKANMKMLPGNVVRTRAVSNQI